MRGAYGVFSAIAFQKVGVAKEEERGKRVADAAQEAGVEHFVYSSVGGAERNSGVAHFESKWHIEQYIRELDLPYSILRPTTFMVNLMEMPAPVRFIALSMSRSMLDGRSLQMIAVEDIGKWAVHMFLNRDRFLSHAVEIAGDEVTFAQMLHCYWNTYSKRPRTIRIPTSMFARGDLGKMIIWIAQSGYQANVQKNHREVRDLLTFGQFVALRRRQ
jgi:nucleoside-diphosphate-sugar epimerase